MATVFLPFLKSKRESHFWIADASTSDLTFPYLDAISSMIRLCGSMHEGVLNIKLLKARALLCVIFLLVLCLLRIWCKRLSTRLFRIAYSREESQINRGKITARSTNGDQYRGTNCHEIAACFSTQFWNRAKHRFRNRTKFMRNLEKRHFLTSWPVPDQDLEMTGWGPRHPDP